MSVNVRFVLKQSGKAGILYYIGNTFRNDSKLLVKQVLCLNACTCNVCFFC